MANAIYGISRKAFLDAGIDLLVDDIRVILIDDTDYTVSIDVHDFLDDVPAGARVAVSGALTTKTTTLGVFDADNITFTAVTGDVSEALIIYHHTGVDSTSELIAYIDTGVTGLPVTPNGGDITVTWDSGSDRIFKI
ncbi:MAG: hypothetical protein V3T88_00120 [Nitrosomonadaceae bacterium]